MFHSKKDSSKVAFHHLVLKCREYNFDFIDSQVPTEHMKQLGCVEISRNLFFKKIKECIIKRYCKRSLEIIYKKEIV